MNWLLKRAGELAAAAMAAWVGEKSLPIEERCQGYGLLPDVNREGRTIEGSCGTIVKKSFEEKIEGTKFLLTETEEPGTIGQMPSSAQRTAGHLVASASIYRV